METLREYFRSLSAAEQYDFARRSGTTRGYVRKLVSVGTMKVGADLAVAFDRESGGRVHCETLRPDIDWRYVRLLKRRFKRLSLGTVVRVDESTVGV